MARIIIETHYPGQSRPEYHRFDEPVLRVGRGLDNDLILADPFVSARHLVITASEDGWLVEDQGSENGLRIGTDPALVRAAAVKSGTVVTVGRVRLRLLAVDHPVVPAQPLPAAPRGLPFLAHGRTTLVAGAAVLALGMLEAYLTDVEPVTVLQLAVTAIWAFVPLVIWSALWSLLTRMTRHHPRFTAHLTWIFLFAVLSLPLRNAVNLAGYLSSSEVVAVGLAVVLFLGWGIALVGGHLLIATQLSLRKALTLAGGLTAVVVVLAGLTALGWSDRFDPAPHPYAVLEPPLVRVVPSQSVEDFARRAMEVFPRLDHPR